MRLDVPGLPVDRHVLRVANRIGLVTVRIRAEVERVLCALLPRIAGRARPTR